jgi:hypothetical protein
MLAVRELEFEVLRIEVIPAPGQVRPVCFTDTSELKKTDRKI